MLCSPCDCSNFEKFQRDFAHSGIVFEFCGHFKEFHGYLLENRKIIKGDVIRMLYIFQISSNAFFPWKLRGETFCFSDRYIFFETFAMKKRVSRANKQKKCRSGWTPDRLETYGSRTDFSIITMKLHFFVFFFFSFLFNFLSFPFSNFGFLILLSWLPSGIPPCPRACGPRAWRGALL